MLELKSRFVWSVVFYGLVLGHLLSSTNVAAERQSLFTSDELAQPIDFQRGVWPLLKHRCFKCHGEQDAQGDLRLDDYDAIQRGGHTGAVILGTVEDSELLRRLISDEDGYRMPKDQTPLSRAEVLRFARWISQGAAWQPPSSIDLLQEASKKLDWNDVLDQLIAINDQIGFLGIPAILCAIGILWIERRKSSLNNEPLNESSSWPLRAVGASHYLVVALAFSLTAVSTLYRNSLSNLRESELARTQSARRHSRSNANESKGDVPGPFAVPQPFHPNHPPRLGGEYYRGNDERNPKLFNGGYYRTATMVVSLRDAKGNRLQWNDTVPTGDLMIRLEIERAPAATPSLFRDEAMTNCRLSRQIPGTDSVAMKDTPVHLSVVQPGERWQAEYVIANIDQDQLQADEPFDLNGLIYLGPNGLQAHYGITYDLAIRGSAIDPKSEVWMGAIFTTGNVHVPKPTEIPLSEWFGFQPIPEITGENSDDPDLLGITEHANELQEQRTGIPEDPIQAVPIQDGPSEKRANQRGETEDSDSAALAGEGS